MVFHTANQKENYDMVVLQSSLVNCETCMTYVTYVYAHDVCAYVTYDVCACDICCVATDPKTNTLKINMFIHEITFVNFAQTKQI